MFKLYIIQKTTLLLIILLLGGCAATLVDYPIEENALHSPFRDGLFPTYRQYDIESEEDVFKLSDEALTYINKSINIHQPGNERIDALVDGLFEQSDLSLIYVSDANTVASDTFRTKSANCLSMSIMAYSLAKEADLEVHFQEVSIPEYWTNRGGYSLLNGHINLRIAPSLAGGVIYFNRVGVTVDFDPLSAKGRFQKNTISREKVLAMYYNNKGADAFVRENYDEAYAYFKASAQAFPAFDDVWVNLGYLYKTKGDIKAAQRTYEHALALDDGNYTGWENLAILLESIGNIKDAKGIKSKIERKRFENPYYHLMLGDQEFNQGNWRAAIKYYKKAIKLDDRPHEFYFGLAKTYFKLGDIRKSAEYLRQAKRNADLDQDKELYQEQLDLFSNI